jgi:wobble nucleotide-excising tRNase
MEAAENRNGGDTMPCGSWCRLILTRAGARLGSRPRRSRQSRRSTLYASKSHNEYQNGINKVLTAVQAGFALVGSDLEYHRDIASSTYKIVINGEAVALGDADTPTAKLTFRNTLGSGDKGILALALFIAQLRQDPQSAAKVVVFDDPFNSQDLFRKDHLSRSIQETSEKAAQVLVLSHDINFLGGRRRLADKGGDRKALEFRRVGQRNNCLPVGCRQCI